MEVNFIYCLIDPRTSERRYIGKAKNVAERFKKHLYPYYLKADTYKNRWLRKLLQQGIKPKIMVLSEVNSATDDINDVERFWIRVFRQAGHRLTNGTDGGDGGRTRPIKPKRTRVSRPFAWYDACKANTRSWVVMDPYGNKQVIENLRAFCDQNGLNPRKMYAVARNEEGRTHHKGWTCKEMKS